MDNNEKDVRKRTNIEKRKANRRSCKTPTDFIVKNRACRGVITDISQFGAFIKSLDVFQIGERVRMVIKSKENNLKRSGIIKWSNQMGFGLRFDEEQSRAQGDAETYNSRGNAHRSRGHIDKAISDYNKAIEIDSMFADAYNDRGLTYGKKGEYDKAISDFNKAIEINPKLSYAYNNRGIAYYFKGQIDRAISDFSKTIEINPRDALAYANRGEGYFSKKEYDEARYDFRKAQALGFKIDPKFLEMLR